MSDNPVIESTKYMLQRCKDVEVKMEGVQYAALKIMEAMDKLEYSVKTWKMHELNPKEMNEKSIDWIFVIDTLNFSFWSDVSPPFTILFNDKKYTGYWALCAAINRALQEGIPITEASYLANITLDQVKHIFRSETQAEIPLIQERVQVLQEAGRALLEKFQGKFVNCVKSANQSAMQLIELVTQNFSSYRDEATYSEGNETKLLKFYKRVQILVADVWACFEGEGLGTFHDIDKITMFADYRVPQNLAYLGVLRYSPELTKTLNEQMIQPQSRIELEIRACSIWAVELIREEILKLNKERKEPIKTPINSIIVDFYLWDTAKRDAVSMEHIPIHRIRSIFY